VVASLGIKEIEDAVSDAQVNRICERFIGSLSKECMNHILIHDGMHLQRAVREYTAYYD